MIERPDIVIKILSANTTSLTELARISELDHASFYQGADLTGLDLSNQDLRGLNFRNADLTNTSLKNIKFDPGAFNGSKLNKEFKNFQDEYEYFIGDILEFPSDEILAFVKFRPNIIHNIISANFRTISSFAKEAKVGDNSLRKARQGSVIAMETAQSILSTLINKMPIITYGDEANALLQPVAMLLSGGNNATFNTLSRTRLDHVLNLRKKYAMDDKIKNGSEIKRWRDTPESLEIYENYDIYINRSS